MDKVFTSTGVRAGGRTFIEFGTPSLVCRDRIRGAIEQMGARGDISDECFLLTDSRSVFSNILILAMPGGDDAAAKVVALLSALARELRLHIEQIQPMSDEAYVYYTRTARRLRASEN